MPDVEKDQTAESTPATDATTGFAEYKSKQEAAKVAELDGKPDAETEEVANEAEAAPADKQEPRKTLTVEERSQRDRERGERRQVAFLNRKLGEERARREAAEKRAAELDHKPESAPGTRPSELVEPLIENFDTTADFNKANAAYLRGVAKAEVAELTRAQETKANEERIRKAQEEAHVEASEHLEDYKERAAAYTKVDKEYEPAFKEISAVLDKFNGDSPDRYIDKLILESEIGPEAVTYLYKHPDAFKEILEAPRERAHYLFGRIEATLALKAPEPKTQTSAPRPGKTVSGRSTTANPDEKYKAAVARGDFTAAQNALREKERISSR